jgi:hypothetical protein
LGIRLLVWWKACLRRADHIFSHVQGFLHTGPNLASVTSEITITIFGLWNLGGFWQN